MAQLYWPFLRIGACFMMAPVFGAIFVPPRIRLLLAGAVAYIVAPLLPTPTITPFSIEGGIVTLQQLLLGFAFALVLQLVFDALAMGGQMLANSMGLSLAFNIDPQHGVSTPVIGQLYMLLVVLTFLALNGHLTLIETLVRSFHTLPIGMQGMSRESTWLLVQWGSQLFVGGLIVALPGMTALLIVNLAFGVMSRAAPSLNLFAVGLPISLVFGLVIIIVGLPTVQANFVQSFDTALQLARGLLDSTP